MSRKARSHRALPPREGYENRNPQRVQRKGQVVTWLTREPRRISAWCCDCSERDGRVPEFAGAWIVERFRANGAGQATFTQDRLTQRDREQIAFLKLVADQHQWETGHYVSVSINPYDLQEPG